MKLTLGYIAAFLATTVFIGACVAGLLAFIVGLISFIFWTIPTGVNYESIMMAVRVCLAIGSTIGILFTLSKEGREFAENFVDVMSGENRES